MADEFGDVVAVALLVWFMPSKALSMFELSVEPPELLPETALALLLAATEKAVLAELAVLLLVDAVLEVMACSA